MLPKFGKKKLKEEFGAFNKYVESVTLSYQLDRDVEIKAVLSDISDMTGLREVIEKNMDNLSKPEFSMLNAIETIIAVAEGLFCTLDIVKVEKKGWQKKESPCNFFNNLAHQEYYEDGTLHKVRYRLHESGRMVEEKGEANCKQVLQAYRDIKKLRCNLNTADAVKIKSRLV